MEDVAEVVPAAVVAIVVWVLSVGAVVLVVVGVVTVGVVAQ
ncbi:MAG: hypothetical protein ACP5HP_04485 [Thermogladius sp.]